MSQDQEFELAIVDNLRLKSKVLAALFGVILLGQLIIIIYLYSSTNLFQTLIPIRIIVFGPMFIISVIVAELLFIRRLRNFRDKKLSFPKHLPYIVVLIETSFPTFIIALAGQFLAGQETITVPQLITSPPLAMYFIMIILSSLMLDLRISIFAGVMAAIEYVSVSFYLLHGTGTAAKVDIINTVFRGGLIFLCGILAGIISHKTRSAVRSSMESKNTLIYKLDHLVAEKTSEVTLKNEILEEKQQEILDSMNYAKRIQESLLPSEKSIARNLERLKRIE